MKNLFSINKDICEGAVAFDENPYLAGRVSDDTRDRLSHAFDILKSDPVREKPTPRQLALKRRARRLWGGAFATLAAAIVLFILTGKINSSLPIVLQLILLAVSAVTTFLARRCDAKLTSSYRESMQPDFAEATARMNAATAEAARELGVPQDAVSLEILPYRYKMADGIPVRAGKKNRFDNISTSAWVADGALFLATAQEVYRIPLSDIRGTRLVDEDFEVDFWLKPEPPDSEMYRAYNIRKAGFFGQRCRTFYAADIGEDYEFFIPCYDFPLFEDLIKAD